MKIIKLDRRHKFYRKNNMKHAIVFTDGFNVNANMCEKWLDARYGGYFLGNSVWASGYGAVYQSRNYYIAVKDESLLTLMFLSIPELLE